MPNVLPEILSGEPDFGSKKVWWGPCSDEQFLFKGWRLVFIRKSLAICAVERYKNWQLPWIHCFHCQIDTSVGLNPSDVPWQNIPSILSKRFNVGLLTTTTFSLVGLEDIYFAPIPVDNKAPKKHPGWDLRFDERRFFQATETDKYWIRRGQRWDVKKKARNQKPEERFRDSQVSFCYTRIQGENPTKFILEVLLFFLVVGETLWSFLRFEGGYALQEKLVSRSFWVFSQFFRKSLRCFSAPWDSRQ